MKHKNCSGEFAVYKIHERQLENYQELLCTKCHARLYLTDSETAAIMDIEELNEVLGKLETLRNEERLDAVGHKKMIAYRRMRELRVNIIYVPVPSGDDDDDDDWVTIENDELSSFEQGYFDAKLNDILNPPGNE